MEKPIITFSKEIISKGDEHLRCCLCPYGKKAGIILWRVEFRSYYYKKHSFKFHWLLCNRCRYLLFVAMGGKRLKNLSTEIGFGNLGRKDDRDAIIYSAKQLLKEPKQRVSNKGKVIPSKQYSKGKK